MVEARFLMIAARDTELNAFRASTEMSHELVS